MGVMDRIVETLAEVAVVAGLGYVAYKYLVHKYPWLAPDDTKPQPPETAPPDAKIDDCCSWKYYLTPPNTLTCLLKGIWPGSPKCKPEPEPAPPKKCNWVNLTLQNCMQDYWVPLFGKYWATSKVTKGKAATICMAHEPNATCPSGGTCSYIKQGETQIFATAGKNYEVTPDWVGVHAVNVKICEVM